MPTSAKKLFLLDSCIAEYCLNNDIQPTLTKKLEEWTNNDFDLAISEISYAELIHGAYKAKVSRVKELLESYSRIEVSQQILRGAGIIGNIYKAHDRRTINVGLADRVIAATCFIHNMPLITANVRDFPHPFFKTVVDEDIVYQKGNKRVLISISILLPKNDRLQYWYSQAK